jgi:Ca2+-dependent lipid-binding protein
MWVQVERGVGLLAMDSNGKSDPRVEVGFDGMKWLTPVVFNELNPVWGDEFRVPVMKVPEEGQQSMVVSGLQVYAVQLTETVY